MKYTLEFSAQFKKSLKKLSQKDIEKCFSVIYKLANDETLDEKHKDHKLKGEFHAYRECHIKPNLLLIYQKQDSILTLICVNVGSHGKLFKS